MKRGLAALAITVVAALMVPGAGSAAPSAVECGGTVADGGTASCDYKFNLDGTKFVSLLGTHANFESLGATGTLKVKWVDAQGATVVEYTCMGLGMPDPLDDHRALCSESSPAAATYAKGVQTMTVTVEEATCPQGSCEYEGAIVFSDEGDPV